MPNDRDVADRYREHHLYRLSLLRSFVERHGLDALRKDTVVAPGVRIGLWLARLKRLGRRGEIATWLRDELERIPGWSWEKKSLLESHDVNIELLVRYVGASSVAMTPDRLRDLGWWIHYRRQAARQGKLDPGLARALEDLPGWRWNQRGRKR